VVVPRRHPWARRRAVVLQDFADQALIAREPGSTTRRVLEARLTAAGIAPRYAMELGSNEAIKHAVTAGVGVAVLGARVVDDEAARGRLRAIRLRGHGLALRFFFVYHGHRAHAPVLRAFLGLARAPRGRR
jgi:DNA-binding transcriptional LysR family regulator